MYTLEFVRLHSADSNSERCSATHVVRVGEHNITSDAEKIQDFVVTKYHFHPDFNLTINYHDLAMIKLPEPVKLTVSEHCRE